MDGRRLSGEHGYTLIETVVAMVLFSGVLLLLVTSIGNLFRANATRSVQEALAHANAEMLTVESEPLTARSNLRNVGRYAVSRTVFREGRKMTVLISVIQNERGDTLVTLHKVILLDDE